MLWWDLTQNQSFICCRGTQYHIGFIIPNHIQIFLSFVVILVLASLLKYLYSLSFKYFAPRAALSVAHFAFHFIILCHSSFFHRLFFSYTLYKLKHTRYSYNGCSQSGCCGDWHKITHSRGSKENKHAEWIEQNLFVFPHKQFLIPTVWLADFCACIWKSN